jgi:hypothetical protein
MVIPPMQFVTARMLEALNAFHPQPGEDAVARLYEITDGFDDLADKADVILAMFALIERADGVDFGAPGPLVHCIESIGHEKYFSQLIESLRRHPQFITINMAHRILNARRLSAANAPGPGEWEQLMDRLRQVSSNQLVSVELRGIASRYVALHSDPRAG